MNLVTVIKDNSDPSFKEAKQREYDGILSKGGFKPVRRDNLSDNANFIGNRYVLTIKDPGTAHERFKARLVLQGHQDFERHKISSNSPIFMKIMLRVIVSFFTVFFKSRFWTRDVEQAYFQSKPLSRDVFTEATPEANLSTEFVLKVQLPHQGLTESGTCLFDTYYPVYVGTRNAKLSIRSMFSLHLQERQTCRNNWTGYR